MKYNQYQLAGPLFQRGPKKWEGVMSPPILHSWGVPQLRQPGCPFQIWYLRDQPWWGDRVLCGSYAGMVISMRL